jgi:drug/metabolite transporter (DMT)-like permease
MNTSSVELAAHQVSWLVPVLGLSLLAAAFAYVAGIGAAGLLGPKLASFVSLTEVLFAVIFAWWFLGESLSVVQLSGAVLVIAGVALVRLDEFHSPGPVSGPVSGPASDPAAPGRTDARVVPEPEPALR